MKRTPAVNRRTFLASASGIAALGLTGESADAAEWTAEERANVKLIEDFFTARWAVPLNTERMGQYLAEDCIRGALDIRVRGRDNILREIQEGYSEMAAADFKVVQTFARGPIVCNERIENLTMKGRKSTWHGIGVFRCEAGKIKEWRTFTMKTAR
jgi:limonene-1,2-epoxide hydrolase